MQKEIQRVLNVLTTLQKINPEFPIQYAICLTHIALKEGLSLTELAEKTGMALSTVSRITAALSKRHTKKACYELIKLEIAPDEKRRKRIFLTKKGKQTIANLCATTHANI